MTATHTPESPAQPTFAIPSQITHPLGSKARVLLTSVFGPYAQDDEYGSREINPMELYQNQVTRTQGPFSLRMFHRSWGIMMIQANISAPCWLLDFPDLDRFIAEIRENKYDIIGITAIMPNLEKVRVMTNLIREHQPDATIVIGGHISNVPELGDRVEVDHVVRGDGIGWFRKYLGEDPDAPINHPTIQSGIGTRAMGVTFRSKPADAAAVLIPSVGCPMGCNFCSTSAMFGGKGQCVHFFESGESLFEVMCKIEAESGARSFFVMDENFLLHRKRALQILDLMEKHNKPWALYVFTSARVLRTYTIDQLVRLGISWVWMGLEGESSQYAKLSGIDTFELVKELQANGIRVLGSTIIGLENHTPENIREAIDYAVKHDTEFHQFMLYTPIPGTPLHAEIGEQGRLISTDELSEADSHGQYKFNYRHAHLEPGTETQLLVDAFDADFNTNGPSILRVVRTTLAGYKKHKDHPDPRVRNRVRWESRDLAITLAGAVWAGRDFYKKTNPEVAAKLDALLRELHKEFGLKSRLLTPMVGRYIRHTLRREVKALEAGETYEPPTFYEKNKAAQFAGARDIL